MPLRRTPPWQRPGTRRHHHRLIGRQFQHDGQFSGIHPHLPHGRLEGGAGAGALFAQHPGGAIEHIERGEVTTIGKGVGRTGDDQQLVGDDGLHHQSRLINPAFDETDLRQTIKHRLRHRLGIADIKPHGHAGIEFLELHQDRRQPVACNGLAGADGNFTTRQPAHFGENQFRIAHTRQRRLGFTQKNPTAFGQFNVAADAMEQLDIIKSFEILDSGA